MDLGSIFAQVTGGIFTTDSPVLLVLKEWGLLLTQHALKKWPAVIMSGIGCDFEGGCGRPAIGACVTCRKPTCLEHAFVSADAIPVCYHCVKNAVPRPRQQQAPPNAPPVPDVAEIRKGHLRTLGLKPNATEENIKAAFKKLAIKFHPDRVADPVKRAVASKKFVEINVAYQWLTKAASS